MTIRGVICVKELVLGDKMGPQQQWRASERIDNGATDPCSMLETAAHLLPLCFLSVGLSVGRSPSAMSLTYCTGLAAFLQADVSPQGTQASVRTSLHGKNKMQREDGENNLAHGFCLRPVELEMRRITHECRIIYFLSKFSE